ncbi:putative efflux protein, MATE family [Aciduliprofundum sp. MAR08-339]|uniref:MATE family efflux transporter n=1 Tax=Aciduliprofundum sp. (strain MAR08-339) TaxID=673860 RepID=UPI0002A48F97|nr:putative efflux protein, MATE family [Aciduliprofundum sp. MAR08-339]
MQLRRTVLNLAIPAVISNVLYTFQNIVDAMMLGRYGNPAVTLSSAGIGGMFYFLTFPLVMGITTGGVAIIARRWGEKRYEEARYTFENLYILLILISIPISLFAVLFGWTLPTALGAGPAVVKGTARYIMGVFTFYPFAVFMAAYQASLRAAGDTKTPMNVDIFANLWNVFWNYALIFGNFGFPQLGVLGAGIATGSSYLFGSLIYLIMQSKGKLVIYPKLLAREKWNMELIKKMFRVGIPAGIERGMWAITSFIYAALIFAASGALGYASFQIGLKAESFAYMPAFGFSIAATTLVGQSLGEGNVRKAKMSAIEATKMSMLFMAVAGAIMILFPQYLAEIFTGDEKIIHFASIYLFLMGMTEPALGALFTLAGGMRGAGYTTMPMVINLTGLMGIRLGIAVVLAFPLGMGLVGIWLGMFFETFIRAGWMYLEFRRGKWAKVRV